ncbi:MAG: GAF domain-containing protein [Polyangiaceae bacterium]|nr:GAF domain-containing protein [Polyangiaceae bacterium]
MTNPKSPVPPAQLDDADEPSLSRECDAFFQAFFKKGAKLTQWLLRENEHLRERVTELDRENADLRLRVRGDQAIRELLDKIQQLEHEKSLLDSRFQQAEAKSSAFEMTYAQLETELANLASLYVAARQLHSSVLPSAVLRHVKEVVEQLIGARSYAIHFASEDDTALVKISSHGSAHAEPARIPLGEGPIGKTYSTGVSTISEDDDLPTRTVDRPAACVPLMLEGRVVGVVTVVATFEQKKKFLPVDYEFFNLLSGHAASAIIAARLFAEADRQIPRLEKLLEHGV